MPTLKPAIMRLTSRGRAMPTKRRILQKQRQHAGMRVQTTVGNLAAGEEPDQGEIAQHFADHSRLAAFVAERGRAASDAREIDAALRFAADAALKPLQHNAH